MSKQDSFELIAKDAVSLLQAIVGDLRDSNDEGDKAAAFIIAVAAADFCDRAIAIGGK